MAEPRKLLSKKDIFSAPTRTYKRVEIPEWDGDVRIQSLTGKERDKFESSLTVTRGNKTKSNTENFRARLVALCVVDENGDLLFTNSREVEALGDGQVAALQKIYNACQALNGFSDEDVESLTEDFDPEPVELSPSA